MYRVGVAAIILNKSNQILTVNLVSFDEIYYAIPGGGLENGESLKDALLREIKE